MSMTAEELWKKYPEILTCWQELPLGWVPLVDRLCAALRRRCGPVVIEATQTKEKFGGLRFYTHMHWEGADVDLFEGSAAHTRTNRLIALVDAAERASFKICMGCGAPGKHGRMYGKNGWLFTYCDEHWKGDRYEPPKVDGDK